MPKITILAQIAREIPRELVESIAKHYQADKYSKGLNTWVHLLTLLFMQLSQTYFLRDACNALKSMQSQLKYLGVDYTPTRNALSHQNQIRDGCTRVPRKSSLGSFNPFLMRFLWMKEVGQQDGKPLTIRHSSELGIA